MESATVTALDAHSGAGAGRVRAGEVHVWAVPLGAPLHASLPWLDRGERMRAAGFLRPCDGSRWAASRAGLRRLLSGYLDADPAGLCFHRGDSGRPAVATHGQHGDCASRDWPDGHDLVPEFEFSLARTEDLAVVALSRSRVGADIERITPRPGLAELADAWFGPGEADCIASGHAGSAPAAGDGTVPGFYRHWTAREAWLKAAGCGLARLREVELTCYPSPSIRFGGRSAVGWRICFPAVSRWHAVAIAARDAVTQCAWLGG